MKRKFWIIIVFLLIGTILLIGIGFRKNQNKKSADVKIPILLYHDFVKTVPETDPDQFQYINTPESFEENINTLLKNGYTFLSMLELYYASNGAIEVPEKPILITFDDGYISNYEWIFPILKKYQVKASIFVVTDRAGKKIDGKEYIGWDAYREMQNSGLVEIFSHSKRHLFYDRFDVRVIRDDVMESYQIIKKELGNKSLKVFAYPYGAYTKQTVWALKRQGIQMQIYDIGVNNLKNFEKDYIKRMNIPCEMTGEEIIEEIEKKN